MIDMILKGVKDLVLVMEEFGETTSCCKREVMHDLIDPKFGCVQTVCLCNFTIVHYFKCH